MVTIKTKFYFSHFVQIMWALYSSWKYVSFPLSRFLPISAIRPIAEKYGICKIRPPSVRFSNPISHHYNTLFIIPVSFLIPLARLQLLVCRSVFLCVQIEACLIFPFYWSIRCGCTLYFHHFIILLHEKRFKKPYRVLSEIT